MSVCSLFLSFRPKSSNLSQKWAPSAGSSVSGYDSETPHEIKNEALYRACRAYGLQVGEQFLAAAQDEGTFGEWLDELPFEVAGCGDRPAAQAPHALWRVGPLGGGGAPRRHRAPRSSAETQTGPRHY